MSVVAVTASRTSPGATSLATGLALALSNRFDRALLVEADPAGGVLSLRFELDVSPSLTTFGSDTRNSYSHEAVWQNTQNLRGVRCMPGPVDPRLARSWVERVSPLLIEHLPTLGAPVVIDLGWVGEDGPSRPLVAAADLTLIVTRPEIAEVQSLLFQVRQLKAAGARVGLVTVGSAPNEPQEIAAVAGVPLVAVLPDDPTVAAALRGVKFAPGKLRRSLLWRTIAGLAEALVDHDLLASRTVQPSPAGSPPIVVQPPVPAAAAAQHSPPVAAEVEPVDPSLYGDTNRRAAPARAELVLDTGERRPLAATGPTVIGRHRDCDIVLPDNQVSRRHARLTHTVAGWHFTDLGSRNGSVLNGRPCRDGYLHSGDELYIGRARLIFQTIPTREMECA